MVANAHACICFSLFIAICSGEMTGNIVGGGYAKIRRYPHAAFLEHHCSGNVWICGGSILTQNLLITAAHCTYGCDNIGWEIVVHAGSENIKTMPIVKQASRFVNHGQYDDATTDNDISLIYVKDRFKFGSNVKRSIISRRYTSGRDLSVAGWGIVNDETREGTIKLKSVPQSVKSYSVCRTILDFGPGKMCAGHKVTSRPSQGDSGSALIDKTGLQIGLVSYRSNARLELVVYTNVTYYYDWIIKKSRSLTCYD